MTPEEQAREQIDNRLVQSGWIVQDFKKLNPMAGLGVAVRDFPTSTGPVDYTYEEKIHHLADQMISIDLDDGVKHNYALFQDVLAKIK